MRQRQDPAHIRAMIRHSLYRPVAKTLETDPETNAIFGVTICDVVEVSLRPGTLTATDADGVTYTCVQPDDWSASAHWVRDTDRATFHDAPRGLARDAHGRPLTAQTPEPSFPARAQKTLYREIGRQHERCSHGELHVVNLYETVVVAPTGDSSPLTGTARRQHDYVDADGNLYRDSSDPAQSPYVTRKDDHSSGRPRYEVRVNGLARDIADESPLTSSTPSTPGAVPGKAES